MLAFATASQSTQISQGERFEIARVEAGHVVIPFASVAFKRPSRRFGLSLASRLYGPLLSAKQHGQYARLARSRRWCSSPLFDEDCIERADLRAFSAADAFFFINVYDAILPHEGLRLADFDARGILTLFAYDRERFVVEYEPS
jgi:hypothetical protein